MQDGYWGGEVQKMNYPNGIPKGLRVVLESQGVNTKGMSADKMREILGSHPDFQNEVSRIERLLTVEYKHICYFLPKYHCELKGVGPGKEVLFT